MFSDLIPPRPPRKKLMHVCDAGEGAVRYICHRCGLKTDWMVERTVTEAKRGIPCPACNCD